VATSSATNIFKINLAKDLSFTMANQNLQKFPLNGMVGFTTLEINTHRFSWQKAHLPNLTGTTNSYSPKKSAVKNTSSEYESWKPNN
jgi:hypothetical protein